MQDRSDCYKEICWKSKGILKREWLLVVCGGGEDFMEEVRLSRIWPSSKRGEEEIEVMGRV